MDLFDRSGRKVGSVNEYGGGGGGIVLIILIIGWMILWFDRLDNYAEKLFLKWESWATPYYEVTAIYVFCWGYLSNITNNIIQFILNLTPYPNLNEVLSWVFIFLIGLMFLIGYIKTGKKGIKWSLFIISLPLIGGMSYLTGVFILDIIISLYEWCLWLFETNPS
ncbi:hypothetical protein [Flammeovirga sp. OC4]|uniref:hypothetical protein n=1 Tax=Flammeovirga sp. OC4 TaxID=1382345 RepID=UPI0005C76665|nr:hypothetical protein [Flammeovirga sp. OC4]